MPQIEVCISPAIFSAYKCDDAITVVVDIFRATTSMCTAFINGAKSIIPVANYDEARALKAKGFKVASEKDGVTLDFADFGNSPYNFTPENVKDLEIVYCTTNGTQAVTIASASQQLLIGAFINITALKEYLSEQNKDVIILCAGWKKKLNMEDNLFAGALVEKLLNTGQFSTNCDSAVTTHEIWQLAKQDLMTYIDKAAHRHRLKRLGLDDVIEYCLTPDITDIIPVLKNDKIVRL